MKFWQKDFQQEGIMHAMSVWSTRYSRAESYLLPWQEGEGS